MIPPDEVFLLLAAIVLVGFALNALFDRIRITSVLPLMLIGVALVQTGVVSSSALGFLGTFTPYVSALTIAFILFSVGLEIQARDLWRVIGRATAYTFAVQILTGVALSLLAYTAFGWSLSIAFVFGFALSGPSAVAVPILVRATHMGDSLRTSLVFESVISDVLQLVVPLFLLTLYQGGAVTWPGLTETLLYLILGSAAAGVAAALVWLWVLDSLREVTRGYTWTLTITLVIATYALADRAGLSAAITIFVFGLTLGNALVLDRPTHIASEPSDSRIGSLLEQVRDKLHLRTHTLDIQHIEEVHREVAFFASAFFFVYLGLLFNAGGVDPILVGTMIGGTLAMLAARVAFLPILAPYFAGDPVRGPVERGLVGFNLSRGLSPAVVATIPASLGIYVPGFVDAMFLGILFSNVVGTIGVFLYYRPRFARPALAAYVPLDPRPPLLPGPGGPIPGPEPPPPNGLRTRLPSSSIGPPRRSGE